MKKLEERKRKGVWGGEDRTPVKPRERSRDINQDFHGLMKGNQTEQGLAVRFCKGDDPRTRGKDTSLVPRSGCPSHKILALGNANQFLYGERSGDFLGKLETVGGRINMAARDDGRGLP